MYKIVYPAFLLLIFYLIFLIYKLQKYKYLNDENKSFVANLTHDLKSPTSAQINMLNLLLKGRFGKLNDEQYEMIKLTYGSTKYMSNLVGMILSKYECETKSFKLHPEVFNIIDIINLICEQNAILANQKSQKIVFNHNNKICLVFADRIQITRVLTNLLSNALTYGFKNSVINIRLREYKNKIEFLISNKSLPISNKELKNIFKKFSKTGVSKLNNASTGLGLYISKKIIDMHKGKIFAKSFNDGTCIFGFSIPVNVENSVFPGRENALVS